MSAKKLFSDAVIFASVFSIVCAITSSSVF